MAQLLIDELTLRIDPAEACACFLDLPGCLLLESVAHSKRLGRFSFVAADPFLVLRSRGPTVERVPNPRLGRDDWSGAGQGDWSETDPFGALREALATYAMSTVPGLPPFQGGAAGYFAYDLCQRLESLPTPRYDDLALPEMWVGLYDWTLAWDHDEHRRWLVSTGLPAPSGVKRKRRATERAELVRDRLWGAPSPGAGLRPPVVRPRSSCTGSTRQQPTAPRGDAEPQAARDATPAGDASTLERTPPARLEPTVRRAARSAQGASAQAATAHASTAQTATARAAATAQAAEPSQHVQRSSPPTCAVPGLAEVRSTFSRADYLNAVERIRQYILAGDIFQANLSQRLESPWDEHPFTLYQRLARRNPAPFAAYFDIGPAAVVSASPERFLRLDGGRVESRPIKGTAPRGITPMHDVALERALAASEKDRAENVMIVDLLRNDLSIVCRDHTVQVPELYAVERYATVHHLVSTVVGELRPDRGPTDLLRSAFPGGSITGAPKIRAMEIIAEIEPTRRNVYTGAIGYIGFDGTMDTNIAIRTFIVKDGTAYFQVGGGIVADSNPECEYEETLDKARGLLAALEERRGPADR